MYLVAADLRAVCHAGLRLPTWECVQTSYGSRGSVQEIQVFGKQMGLERTCAFFDLEEGAPQ